MAGAEARWVRWWWHIFFFFWQQVRVQTLKTFSGGWNLSFSNLGSREAGTSRLWHYDDIFVPFCSGRLVFGVMSGAIFWAFSVLFTLFFVKCVYFIVSHLSLVSSCTSWLMFLSWFWEVCQVLSCLVLTSGCSLYLPSSSCFRLWLPLFVWFPPASCCLMSLTCGPPPSCINSPRLPLSGFRSLS